MELLKEQVVSQN